LNTLVIDKGMVFAGFSNDGVYRASLADIAGGSNVSHSVQSPDFALYPNPHRKWQRFDTSQRRTLL